uniref:Reverse transcriptase domain-containing protein n=1 Tax=Tanacetum cinerariifolium TaxID=118510 RepID=A0A6L2JI43_TANCI|nr:reverse transcriptase domain-containing protein [Tanacetum cinerariifolium]
MRTRSSSNLPVVSPPNPSTSNPKRRNRRRSKQPFILEESPVDTIADQHTMAELLRVPTEGYVEEIVVPLILVEQFELKHSLINMMTSDQFFGLEKENPHDHIRAAQRWLEKEPSRSILTWEDLVSKFINELFPPSRTTNLRNEISNFQQWFDESFHEAWDRYKDLLRACLHHGFTELHQLDTFYNALNPADQVSLNSATGDNLLEKQIAKLTHVVNQQTSVVTTAMKAILKQFQATTPPASIKAVKESCVTCGGAHPYYQCLAAGGNTFPELRDNIQGYVLAAAVNYNKGNSVYRPPALLSNKEKLQELENTPFNENCSAVILKKLPKKLGDPGKFLISCGFNELKCKALADLGAPELISTRMTLELANRAICTPIGIAKDVFVSVGKFTFPANFVIVDYEIDPRVPLILGRPFLRTARALIDIHGEEMILHDGDEILALNMRHDTSSYSNQPQKESINLINVFNDLSEDFLEDLFSTNHQSGNLTFSFHPEFTSSEVKDDIFDPEGSNFDIESDLKEIEYLLHHDPIKDIDSSLKDSIDQSNLADLNNNFVDSMPEMFTDEHALDYSSPLLFDEYMMMIFSKLSPTLKMVDALPSTNNEDKAISHASLMIEDVGPPLYEPLFFKEVPRSKMLLLFSSEIEEKVFKPRIHTSENVHSYLITEISHQGYKVFKINQIFKSSMKIFLFSCGKDTHILVVPYLFFYPLDQFKYGGFGLS